MYYILQNKYKKRGKIKYTKDMTELIYKKIYIKESKQYFIDIQIYHIIPKIKI